MPAAGGGGIGGGIGGGTGGGGIGGGTGGGGGAGGDANGTGGSVGGGGASGAGGVSTTCAGAVIPSGTKRIFVTSSQSPGDLVFATGKNNAFEAADQICANAAASAKLGGTFIAWLSTSKDDAIARVLSDGTWVLLDGTVAFQGKNQLMNTPNAAINLDEHCGELGKEVWTGTALGGTKAPETCLDWTVKSLPDGGKASGRVGQSGAKSSAWTTANSDDCQFERSLCCLEM